MATETQQYALPNKTKSSFGQGINIVLDKQYQMCWIEEQHSDYNLYQGIDVVNSRWVHIYIKQKEGQLLSTIQECSRSPKKPSLPQSHPGRVGRYWQVSIWIRGALEVRTLTGSHVRAGQGKNRGKGAAAPAAGNGRLVQKLDSLKLVSGELNTKNIVFDPSPKRNQLYLLNCFSLKKRQQEGRPIHSRYCSRGAHLGRTITIKDDLESVCYILIDIFTEGAFLKEKMAHEYKEQKLSLKIEQFAEGLPNPFIEFYHYVISLNYADDINYFYWKTHLTKILSPDVVARPYRFLSSNNTDTHTLIPSKPDVDDLLETLEYQGNEELEKKLNKVERTIATNQKFKNFFA